MLQPPPDRRLHTHSFVEKLLLERQDMLVLFCQVAGLDLQLKPRKPATEAQVQQLLDEFCQILVDYIAAGYFILYQRLLEQRERRQAVLKLAQQLYPAIADTTEIALQFNEKYENPSHFKLTQLAELQHDLSRLGEQLAQRIELEDQLLSSLLSKPLSPHNHTRH